MRDLVAFVQFKKREKHPWRNVNFSKVAGFSRLKSTLLHGCFLRFLNCTNATISCNASQIGLGVCCGSDFCRPFASIHWHISCQYSIYLYTILQYFIYLFCGGQRNYLHTLNAKHLQQSFSLTLSSMTRMFSLKNMWHRFVRSLWTSEWRF